MDYSRSAIHPLQWLPDDRVDKCKKCKSEFGFFTRKHHCRYCGLIFCSDCSSNTLELRGENGETEASRLCDICKVKVPSPFSTTVGSDGVNHGFIFVETEDGATSEICYCICSPLGFSYHLYMRDVPADHPLIPGEGTVHPVDSVDQIAEASDGAPWKLVVRFNDAQVPAVALKGIFVSGEEAVVDGNEWRQALELAIASEDREKDALAATHGHPATSVGGYSSCVEFHRMLLRLGQPLNVLADYIPSYPGTPNAPPPEDEEQRRTLPSEEDSAMSRRIFYLCQRLVHATAADELIGKDDKGSFLDVKLTQGVVGEVVAWATRLPFVRDTDVRRLPIEIEAAVRREAKALYAATRMRTDTALKHVAKNFARRLVRNHLPAVRLQAFAKHTMQGNGMPRVIVAHRRMCRDFWRYILPVLHHRTGIKWAIDAIAEARYPSELPHLLRKFWVTSETVACLWMTCYMRQKNIAEKFDSLMSVLPYRSLAMALKTSDAEALADGVSGALLARPFGAYNILQRIAWELNVVEVERRRDSLKGKISSEYATKIEAILKLDECIDLVDLNRQSKVAEVLSDSRAEPVIPADKVQELPDDEAARLALFLTTTADYNRRAAYVERLGHESVSELVEQVISSFSGPLLRLCQTGNLAAVFDVSTTAYNNIVTTATSSADDAEKQRVILKEMKVIFDAMYSFMRNLVLRDRKTVDEMAHYLLRSWFANKNFPLQKIIESSLDEEERTKLYRDADFGVAEKLDGRDALRSEQALLPLFQTTLRKKLRADTMR